MMDSNDPLDLFDDDGDGVVEISLLEEEDKRKNSPRKNNSGCCIIFLLLGSPLYLAAWYLIKYRFFSIPVRCLICWK